MPYSSLSREEIMKKLLSLLVFLVLALLPLACSNRAVTQPVNPTFAATPTPTWSYSVSTAATPTPTP